MGDVLDFEVRIKMAEQDINKLNAQLNQVKQNAENSGNSIDASFQKAAKSAMKMAAALGTSLSLGALVKQVYKYANAFDQAAATIETISDEIHNNIDDYKQQMLDLTTEIPIAADEAAKAMYQIVSAGHDGADGMKVLEVAAKAAIGGVTDTATAADAITTLLNAYKLSAEDAEKISDQLFTTAKLGKTTFGELGRHIAQAAPIAASFGIETEQLTAAIATLTKSGVPTAHAMTQIRAAIISASKVLGDGYFATHTFQEGLQEISDMAGGSESKFRELVPEIEAMNGILGLTGINAQAAASDLEKMSDVAGATGEAFGIMADTSEQQLILLKNNIMAALTGIGSEVVEAFGGLAANINKMFDDGTIQLYTKALKVAIAAFGAYKATVLIVTAVQKAHMKVLKTAIAIKRSNALAGIAMSNAEAAAAARTKLLTLAQKKLNKTMMMNPYGLALAAITALGLGIYEYIQYANRAEKKQDEFNKKVAEMAAAPIAKIESLSTSWKALGDDLKAKEQFIKDNAEAFNELGVSINSVQEAERLLIDQKDEFIAAQMAKAKAAAYQQQAEELTQKVLEKEAEIRKKAAGPYKVRIFGPDTREEIQALDKEIEELNKEIQDLYKRANEESEKAKIKIEIENPDPQATEKVFQDPQKEIAKYIKLIAEAKKRIRGLRSGKVESVNIVGDIKKEEEKLEEYQSSLERLRGEFKQDDGQTNYAAKAAEEALKMEEQNHMTKLQNEAEEARQKIDNLDAYYLKEQEIIDKEYEDKKAAIEREREDALKNAKREDKAKINEGYDKQQRAAEEAWRQKTTKNEKTKDAEVYKNKLTLYQAYVEEYLRIKEEQKSREEEIDNLAKDQQITEEEAEQRKEQSNALAGIDVEAVKAQLGLTEEDIAQSVSDVVEQTVMMSIAEIGTQLPILEEELKRLQAAGADPAKIAKTTAQIKLMKAALSKAKKATTDVADTTASGALTSKEKLQVVADSLYVINDALSDVTSAFGDMFSEGGQVAVQIMQSVLSASTAIIGSLMAVSTTAIAQMSALEKASVILTIISVAIQVITAITNALMSHYSAHAIYNKEMEKSKQLISEMEKEQKKFDHELEKKSGSDYWKSFAQGAKNSITYVNELNAALQKAYTEKERAESAGKDKAANDAQKDIDELDEKLMNAEKDDMERRKTLLEEFATTSLESYAQSMAEAMVEGFSNGMDGIKESWDDTIKDLKKAMLTRQLALALEDQFKEAFDKLSEGTADGSLTQDEMNQFYELMDQGSANAQMIGEKYREIMAQMGLLDDATIEAEHRGFETMSQDTADELNGRFTALQISGANIETKLDTQIEIDKINGALMQSIRDNVDLITNIANDQLNELKAIRDNTALLSDTNRRLKAIEDNTSKL